MSNEHLPDPNAPGPQPNWGGEYDSEATGFLELPGGLPERGGSEPLAAPGQGYQPPVIEPAAPLPTPGPSMDPAATGQWTLPFAAQGGPPPVATGPDAPAGPAEPFQPVERSEPPRHQAMGQGAAAALAGSHEGRAERGAADGAPDAPEPHQAEPDAWRPPGGRADEPPAPAPWSAPADGEPHPAEPAEPPAAGPGPAASSSEHPETSYVLRVNGAERQVTDAWIGESLLYVLRERLGLAGAKDGCAQGECGACSVQVDGRLVAACLVPAATAAGSEIRTVEGLGADGEPSDVQRALAGCDVQCGFCLPGMAMTVHDLLEGNHAPTELETRHALCGNLCRCGGYRGVLDAVAEVVAERAARSAAEHAEPAGPVDHVGTDAAAGPVGPAPDAVPPRIPHQSGPPAAAGGYPQAGGM
ncbi:2Fe-2S iron-sulfur cluster-binding protein [Streptomyces sp. DSM 44915]|uniref:2Fe-2S iron-sulfur cluster-binding protein n=1 Tax=Streptomyces chisholmiae TaxID=3075540 RepID=A0ABU2JUI5_9ACTN|nr:2Fe-2S iron-sulfur cluster-binding protein [Streptomyces sp. DSM 44915]MDT0267863.1 2Fe-2S iron-sulfur cluster-binding protein [Streptomyces sp. DSM 44915]